MEKMLEVIGFLAAIFTTISFLPQVIKTWKTRSTKDISLLMFTIFCTGVFLWIIYGIYISSLQIILANVFTFILAFIILLFKIRDVFKHKKLKLASHRSTMD